MQRRRRRECVDRQGDARARDDHPLRGLVVVGATTSPGGRARRAGRDPRRVWHEVGFIITEQRRGPVQRAGQMSFGLPVRLKDSLHRSTIKVNPACSLDEKRGGSLQNVGGVAHGKNSLHAAL